MRTLATAVVLVCCQAATAQPPADASVTRQALEARHGAPQQEMAQPDGSSRLRWVVTGQRFLPASPLQSAPIMTLDSAGLPVISQPNPMLQRRDVETWACTLDYLLDAQGRVRELRLSGTGCDSVTR